MILPKLAALYGILHCRPHYAHAVQCRHFVSERSGRKGLSLGCVFYSHDIGHYDSWSQT